MAWYSWVVVGLLALVALYLFLIAPSHKHPTATGLVGKQYAHRGLHDGNHTVFENSLLAFEHAVNAGFGIELDVQLTADQRLIVHHDSDTRRVCGVAALIRNTPYSELPLLPDGTRIPTFAQVLALVDGKAPLIVEVKHYGSPTENAIATYHALQGYTGAYCVESFHPTVVQWFAKHAPDIMRGQLAAGGKRNPAETSLVEHFALKYLLINAMGRPHFVAYSCATDRNPSMWLMKRLFHPLLAAWTIRNQQLLTHVEKTYQMPIFELFTPTKEK